MKLLGVDTGGTFTDFAFFDDGVFHTHKVLSTPKAPEQAIIEGIRALGIKLGETLVFTHGSTVATNAVLEKKGVKTAYITNRGFADILTIGRQARRHLYDLKPQTVPPPVPRQLCLETGGRITATGEILEDLNPEDLAELKRALKKLSPEAVAINLLFSFIDDRFEHKIARALEDDYFVSRSSEILPEVREYERGIATWLNSYIGPLMRNYLQQLNRTLPKANIRVMQSHGHTTDIKNASKHSVHLLSSGPAGGVIAAQQIATLCQYSKALSFDMGGTSTDISMIDGEVLLTNEGHIGDYPVSIPMVDLHIIGSGGSSMVYIDAGGLLRVGPQSAGADPGPACYDKGGACPTITDANLLLKRLPQKLGDKLTLNAKAAEAAFKPLADRLGMTLEKTAAGAIDIVNEQMTQALRMMSAQRNHNPKDFLLIGFGAASGLHICALAENMRMTRAVVPAYAGVLSSLGMLTAQPGLKKSRTLGIALNDADEDHINNLFDQIHNEIQDELNRQQVEITTIRKLVELCYTGQGYRLTLEWQHPETLAQKFHQAHTELRGYRIDNVPIELSTIQCHADARARIDMASLLKTSKHSRNPKHLKHLKHRNTTREPTDLPLFQRNGIGDEPIAGPAIIIETVSTIYVKKDWQASSDQYGNLHLQSSTA